MKSIFVILFLISSFPSYAQQTTALDTMPSKKPTLDTKSHHSVKKAVLYSSLVPGLGQIYNKKWWKVPIIYAGFGGLGFAIGWNTKKYRTYRDAYRLRVDGDTATVDEFINVYSEANLLTLKDYYRRNRDLAIIFTTVLYALNIIDAAVDAHLFEYDISDDLSLRVEPQLQFSGHSRNFAGVNLTMRF